MKSKHGVDIVWKGIAMGILLVVGGVEGSWWQSDNENVDVSMYGGALTRDWLYDAQSISLRYEGCVVGYDTDNEESGCPENESDEGTTYWYMMANCMRPQATFSLFSSDTSTSVGCSSSTFKESMTTTGGFAEFLYYLQKYDGNNNFQYNGNGNNNENDNDDGDDDYYNDGQMNYENIDDLPTCEQTDYGYIGLGCSDYGNVVLRLYQDQYCLGIDNSQIYDELNSINKALKSYKNCASAYSYGDGQDNALAFKLVYYSNTCSSIDNSLCKNDDITGSNRLTNKVSTASSKVAPNRSWITKLKYVAGGMLLVASFVMFTGILFTNRRRRRALMQRKYRQSRKSRSGRSKSRTGDSDGVSRKSGRSKSRNREKDESGGVFT